MFSISHEVKFYETDLMGIVHHSNYLRFFEEVRVAWARAKGIVDYQKPETASFLAVVDTAVKHKKPCFFGDHLRVDIEGKMEGVLILFQYRLVKESNNEVAAYGKTSHVGLNKDYKIQRLKPELVKLLEKEIWTETWHLNL